MAFAFVVDDRAPDKIERGGALRFLHALGEAPIDEARHQASCPSCQLIGEPLACVGFIPTPLSADVERWLIDRLPGEIESVGGFLLQKAIGDFGYDGARARGLRARGALAAPGPYEKHYGPFYRRFVVSSEQILEELLCAGDLQPSHALAILMHLQAIEVDGKVPSAIEEGDRLGSLVEKPDDRRARTRYAAPTGSGDPSLRGVQALLRALYAGFVVDRDVYLVDSDEPEEAEAAEKD
jgi:hypothetical protein